MAKPCRNSPSSFLFVDGNSTLLPIFCVNNESLAHCKCKDSLNYLWHACDVLCNLYVSRRCNVCLHVVDTTFAFADITSSTPPRHWTNLCILSSLAAHSRRSLCPQTDHQLGTGTKVCNLPARYPGL